MEYNLKYKHIKKDVINAVRKTILRDRIFKINSNMRLCSLHNLNKKLCEIYKIKDNKKPKLRIARYGDGYFIPCLNIIILNKNLSLITYLHEFKHFLQYHFNKKNSENIARGYSISLFYLASPRHFKRALRKGLIIHMKTE